MHNTPVSRRARAFANAGGLGNTQLEQWHQLSKTARNFADAGRFGNTRLERRLHFSKTARTFANAGSFGNTQPERWLQLSKTPAHMPLRAVSEIADSPQCSLFPEVPAMELTRAVLEMSEWNDGFSFPKQLASLPTWEATKHDHNVGAAPSCAGHQHGDAAARSTHFRWRISEK